MQQDLFNNEEYKSPILGQWNAVEKNYSNYQSIDDLFRERVSKTPAAIALIDGGQELSFHELNQLKNKIANYLILNSCIAGQAIAVKLENTSYLIATLLAIQSIGCKYVPIDREIPAGRVGYILEDSESKFLLDEVWLAENLAEIMGGSDEFFYPETIVDQAEYIECIVYTSGSTGNPKGVKINRLGIMNRLYWMWNRYPFKEDEVCCVKTSIGFVDHIWEIFGPLLKGIPSVLIKKEELFDIRKVIEKLAHHGVSRLVLVPSLLDELLNADRKDLLKLEKLNLWTCSGEELKYQLVKKFYDTFQSDTKRLLNIYGSTEVTADATYFDTYEDYNTYSISFQHFPKERAGMRLSIGTPIDHVQVSIMDEDLKPVPYDTLGEICVWGACLSSGYVSHEMPQNPFCAHPFIPGEQLYRTGDYGKLMPNGQIIYWGRKDARVKIRGYRIELAEIEYALAQIEGIKQACVLAKEIVLETGTHSYLVGYYRIDEGVKGVSQEVIQHCLSQVLPEYMVPRVLVQLESFPLTISGKVDKLALPEPDFILSDEEYMGPHTEMEAELCAIWQEVLGLDRVGVRDEFFRIGGNSILAIQVSHRMSQVLGYEVHVADVFKYPCIAQLLLYTNNQILTNILKIEAYQADLSFAQERLWFIEQYEQGTSAYHLPEVYELDVHTDLDGIKYAIQQIVSRHEVLRSTIEVVNQGHGIQSVHQEPLFIEHVILTDESDYWTLLKEDILRPFDLQVSYPIRVKFYTIQSSEESGKSAPSRTILLINLHHIASDGWSSGIFRRELWAYYQAYVSEEVDCSLSPLDIQYKDYAVWQKRYFNGSAVLENQLNYWTHYLSGYQTLELPTDYSRPSKKDYRGSSEAFTFDEQLSERLRALAQQHGTTIHTVLLSGLYVLLGKYTGQDDIVVGGLTAGRHVQKTEDLIGFFVNTQVHRAVLSKTQNFDQLIQQVHLDQIQAQLHQDMPFEKLVSELGVNRDASRHPIFQVLFTVQDFNSLDWSPVGQFESYLKPISLTGLYEVEKFDLSITIDNSYPALSGQISYATSLFHQDTIQRLIGYYTHLLMQLVETPGQPYHSYSLLNADQYNQLIHQWNATESAYPRDRMIHQLFQEQVARTPHALALVFGKQKLTYQALHEKSNQLARHIRQEYDQRTQKPLEPNTLIALYLDRSVEMLIGILAVMKAGGAYVPIDISYPQERVDYILEDTGAAFVLTQSHLRKNHPVQLPQDKLIQIDLGEEFYGQLDTSDLPQLAKSKDLAYVIYTSGTTGRPKGVIIEHKAFAQFIYNFNDYLCDKLANTSKNLLSLTNYVFDIFGLEYALPLITGHAIILSSIHQVTAEEIAASGIIQQTPSTLLQLVLKYPNELSDKICLVGGEALLPSIAEKLIQSFGKVFNVYGPAETVIWSTAYEVKDASKPYIGKPLLNEQVYVLDGNKSPVPIGVKGELYIGGAGLAQGYLNQPELTDSRFIPNPFVTEADQRKGYTRLYRTGDWVRYLSDGNLEFIGRYDNQVKIRGYRIELGEIEQALVRIHGIKQACVLVKEKKLETGSAKYLVAYYEASFQPPPLEREGMRLSLMKILPEYMIPNFFVQLESFPLTVNGKLDKNALPEPDSVVMTEEQTAPSGEIEMKIASIWQEVLGLEKVGIMDDFFKIGGDSILSIRLVNRMIQAGLNCEVKDIFDCKTIAKLAAYLSNKCDGSVTQVPVIDWEHEAQLDPAIVPSATTGLIVNDEPTSILLTGATGFVGVHLLAELLEQTRANIYCLVRAVDVGEAMEKIRKNLGTYQLGNEAFMSRIIPLVGSLSLPYFGWDEQQFQRRAAQIDMIYHSGAWVNFVYPYSLLKPTNVQGTEEIIRFACCAKLKPVHHVSTFSVFSEEAFVRFGEIEESTPLEVVPELLDGYSQSKWVSERLVLEAQKRGIPATIYRLGHITGHSQIGTCHTSDLLWNQIKSCIQLQTAPILTSVIDITPVDFVSNSIVHLSKKNSSLGKVFHLINKDTIAWNEVFNYVRALGYHLEPRTSVSWRQELLARVQHDPQNALYPFLSLFTDDVEAVDHTDSRFNSEQTHAELVEVVCHPSNLALFERYFRYFIDCGFLEPVQHADQTCTELPHDS